ncbi:histidine kinase [Ferruginibacter sp.]
MKHRPVIKILFCLLVLYCCGTGTVRAQEKKTSSKFRKASKKVELGLEDNRPDTLAQGYFDLGESYYQKGELQKSETSYQKSKQLYEKLNDAEGVAKSSRALAKVQEDLHKDKEAIVNYNTAQQNNFKSGDLNSNALNGNDIKRLSMPDTGKMYERFLQANLDLGRKNKDTSEIIASLSRMAQMNLKKNALSNTVSSYYSAYQFSRNNPEQALRFNQNITDLYVKDKNFTKAIAAKQEVLKEPFVKNSTQLQASEITSLADIYIQKKDDSTAIQLLQESYALSVQNGHTMEAKKCIERLDSIYQQNGKKAMSLDLYKHFLQQLPDIIDKDSSLVDNKIIEETEGKIKKLENEKALKDDLIRRKNVFNYWLIGSVIALIIFTAIILFILKKLQVKNKKIALQSLRREMNPHFIFNSLNSINQFIANNNELEANQYLTRFSTLMRRVMENSKEDFVLFAKETELLQHYLELEKSRFPDKFNFKVTIDDALYADEHLYIPGMLIQPYLENAVWHGLRYGDEMGLLQLSFIKNDNNISIHIEDNGIGIAESKKAKTSNQQQHKGRGITNTQERIKILNELYHLQISCTVEDKPAPDHGVRVKITVPVLKNIKHEN